MTGKVWLVGAGPGDAGLMTIKGCEVLSEADVVVYDALVGPGVLNLILEWINYGTPLSEDECVELIHEFSKVMYRNN